MKTAATAAKRPASFPVRVSLRAPDAIMHAIAVAANRRHTTLSETLRRYVIMGLHADGVQVVLDTTAEGSGGA